METVRIGRHSPRLGHFSIACKNSVLSSDVILKVDYDKKKITISRAGMDYRGRTQKANKGYAGRYTLFCKHELPCGKFDIAPEESNEDTIVIYYT